MNAKQMLKAAGCSDTVAGRKKFHDMYPTPGHFFAKHGGELSGAPHNGQPTAAEFFAWGQPIVGPQGFYGDGGSNKMKLSNDEVVKMATTLLKSPYSSLNMEDYNKLSEADKTRVRSIYDNASKYSAGSKGKFPFTPGSSAYWKSDLKDASDSAQYLSGYQRGEPLNREEAIGRAMFIQDDLNDGQPSILNPTMSGEFQRNDDYEKMGQGWSPKKMGGDVEYNRALALVTKAMGGQAGVEMRSTNDYIQNENGYLTDYLNQGQQEFMRNGGNLMQARNGVDIGGPNAPEQGSSQSTNYSDGYTGNNNQNYNPYLVNQHSFTNGYTPYMGMFGALANTAGRFGPKLKIKNKMYGNVNYYGNQQGAAGQGSSQGSSSPSAGNNGGGSSAPGQSQQNNPEGYTPYTEVIKRGIFNRLAPNKFAPKHVRVGWEKTGQGNNASANNGAPGNGTPSGGGSGAGTNAKSPYQQNTQMSPYEVFMSGQGSVPANAYPIQGANGGKYMGPDMNESDTTLPQMNIQRQSPFGAGFPAMYGPQEVSSDDYSAKSNYSPFTQFTDQPVGPVNAYGMYKKGGVPRFVNGGSGTYTPDYRDQTDIYGGLGFNVDNLNPWQMEGAANELGAGINQIQYNNALNKNNTLRQDVMYGNTADLEYKGNQRTFDSNIASNQTPRLTTFAGDSNVDNQIGGSRGARYGGTMQGGGAVNIGDEIDIPDDELEQFLANGGQVEYL